MPTILIEGGYRFIIFVDDHSPAHTHVRYQGNKVVIEFENEIRVRNISGMNRRTLARAIRIVERERDFFVAEWRKIHE